MRRNNFIMNYSHFDEHWTDPTAHLRLCSSQKYFNFWNACNLYTAQKNVSFLCIYIESFSPGKKGMQLQSEWIFNLLVCVLLLLFGNVIYRWCFLWHGMVTTVASGNEQKRCRWIHLQRWWRWWWRRGRRLVSSSSNNSRSTFYLSVVISVDATWSALQIFGVYFKHFSSATALQTDNQP